MSDLLDRLLPKERRGSKPRCHWLTHGSRADVARRLDDLAAPWATVSPDDHWMPEGFENCVEAQLHQSPRLLDPDTCEMLGRWWLPANRLEARTPNFDIASTCTIEGRRGLLLVEAKAHDEELTKETVGRRLGDDPSDARKESHETIGEAIGSARSGLSDATSLRWQISRDSHYQMSNRFAWSWKLAANDIPVVLVYLGFLDANEMHDRGIPFATHEDWDAVVRVHSEPLFPDQVWNNRWPINGVPLIPLIRSVDEPLLGPSAA